MTQPSSVSNSGLLCTDSANAGIARAIDLFIGNGRRYSFEEAATALQMTPAALYSYVRENDRRTPPGGVLLRLCHFLGPEFTSKLLGGAGQGAHYLDPQPGEPGYVIARLAKGTGEFAWRGADHRYCHVDRGHLEPVADEMIQILQPFSSKAGGEQ